MDESRRLLVSKDIPLSRVGRLKSLFQLGKPIPVEELQFDGGRSNQDSESTVSNVPGDSEGEVNAPKNPDEPVNAMSDGAEGEQPRINTAVVAKRFRSAKAIFDQIEQSSMQNVTSQSPVRRTATKSNENATGRPLSETSAAESPSKNSEETGLSSEASGATVRRSESANSRQKPPLVTRPKPVLSAEQIRALQMRTVKEEARQHGGSAAEGNEQLSPSSSMQNEESFRASQTAVENGVNNCERDEREEANVSEVNGNVTNGTERPMLEAAENSTSKRCETENPTERNEEHGNAHSQSTANETAELHGAVSAVANETVVCHVEVSSKRVEIMSESDSDAVESVPSAGRAFSREDVPSVDDEEEAEEEEENLRDFEDNERRLTIEYRLEQMERERERERESGSTNYGAQFVEATNAAVGDVQMLGEAAIDVHYLEDGNFFFDVPGLPCASRDGTIDDEAEEAAPTEKAQSGGKRRVHFSQIGMRVYTTLAPFEYDRRNEDIDPIGASAEYELEKRIEKMDLLEVELEKDADGLGISIVGMGIGAEAGIEKLGIFVKAVALGGAAARDGRIRVCDQLIEVDSTSLVGVTQAFAAQVLRNTRGLVHFVVGRERDVANSDIARLISLSLEQDRVKQQRLAQLLQAAHAQPNVTPAMADLLARAPLDAALNSASAPIATVDGDEAEREREREREDERDTDAEEADSDEAAEYNTGLPNPSSHGNLGDNHETRPSATGPSDSSYPLSSLLSSANRHSWGGTELTDPTVMLARFDELHARNVALEAELALLRTRLSERDLRQSQAEQKLGELIQIKVSLELQLQLAKDQLESERRQFADRESQLRADLDLVTRKYKKVKRLYKEQLTLLAQYTNANTGSGPTSVTHNSNATHAK